MSTATTTVSTETTTRTRLWKPGFGYAVAAALATTVTAAVAHAAGVSLEIEGEQIPLAGFAQLAFVFSMVGVGLAAALRTWARTPERTFVRATVVLTALSFVPDLITPDIDVATRVTLMLTHAVAAAIVIPGVARKLR